MEKIQQALSKARKERQGARPQLQQRGRQSSTRTAVTPTDEAWLALEEVHFDAKELLKNRVYAEHGDVLATQFDILRTKVMQQMQANEWRRIAITSPTSGCGKSTLSANLAFSLGRQPETRATLMEMDLRRPSLGRMLKLRIQDSFAEVLDGAVTAEQQGRRYHDNLGLFVNRGPFKGSAELYHSSQASAIIDQIESDYQPDVMVFDMPPVLGSDDMMAFASHVDCVLLLGAAEETTVKQLDLCERELATQTNVMGVILNKCRYIDKSASYYYHY